MIARSDVLDRGVFKVQHAVHNIGIHICDWRLICKRTVVNFALSEYGNDSDLHGVYRQDFLDDRSSVGKHRIAAGRRIGQPDVVRPRIDGSSRPAAGAVGRPVFYVDHAVIEVVYARSAYGIIDDRACCRFQRNDYVRGGYRYGFARKCMDFVRQI